MNAKLGITQHKVYNENTMLTNDSLQYFNPHKYKFTHLQMNLNEGSVIQCICQQELEERSLSGSSRSPRSYSNQQPY